MSLPVAPAGRVAVNLPAAALVEAAITRGEGQLTAFGALSCFTGKRTGRSPGDKFLVQDATTKDAVNWGKVNQPMSPATFAKLVEKVSAYHKTRDLFVIDAAACADPTYRLRIRVVTETAWHALFAKCLFLRPSADDLKSFTPDWTILHAPNLSFDPATDGTKSEACVVADFASRTVVIAGTQYAGEIKKSVFTILNFLLPGRGVIPMHCSA